MSLEQDLLKAADELEKTAMEMENNEKEESKSEEKAEEKSEAKPEEKSEEKSEEKAEAKSEEKSEEKPAESEKTAQLKEELGITDDELAEKVASADPSVVEYIKNLNQQPVESMGGEDTREKVASEDDESDPFGDFLETPL